MSYGPIKEPVRLELTTRMYFHSAFAEKFQRSVARPSGLAAVAPAILAQPVELKLHSFDDANPVVGI